MALFPSSVTQALILSFSIQHVHNLRIIKHQAGRAKIVVIFWSVQFDFDLTQNLGSRRTTSCCNPGMLASICPKWEKCMCHTGLQASCARWFEQNRLHHHHSWCAMGFSKECMYHFCWGGDISATYLENYAPPYISAVQRSPASPTKTSSLVDNERSESAKSWVWVISMPTGTRRSPPPASPRDALRHQHRQNMDHMVYEKGQQRRNYGSYGPYIEQYRRNYGSYSPYM